MSSTPKQKRAVKILTENNRMDTKGNVLKKAGYSDNISKQPSVVIESKGFQEAMNEAGLTDSFLNKCLSEDITKKPQNRKPEVELAYKLKGRLTDKVDLNVITPKPLLDSILDPNGEITKQAKEDINNTNKRTTEV